MIERYSFDPVIQRAQELEVLQNALALDPATLAPWTRDQLLHSDSNKQNIVRFARTAIKGVLPRLTTSPEDVNAIAKLLRHDQLLRRLS